MCALQHTRWTHQGDAYIRVKGQTRADCTCTIHDTKFTHTHTHTHIQQKKKAEGPTDPQQPAKKRPPTIPEATPPVAVGTTSGDPEALKQQIEAQGNKVRDLKSGGADKVG